MTEEEFEKKINSIEARVEQIQADLSKIKKYFLWSFIATIVTFVLPLLAAAIFIPIMLNSYLKNFEGLL